MSTGIANRIRKKRGRAVYNKKGPKAPYLISFPRSGRHWYTLLLEKNLKIPCCRYQTPWVEEKTAEQLRIWAAHELSLAFLPQNFIYLNRKDSVAVLFSLFMMNREDPPTDPGVAEQARLLKRHREFYLPHARLVVNYEDLVRDSCKMVEEGARFFGVNFDPVNFQEVTREEVNGIVDNEISHRNKRRYVFLRQQFERSFGTVIREQCGE